MSRDPAYAESYPQYMAMDAEADAERVAAGESEDAPQSEAYFAHLAQRHVDMQKTLRFIRGYYPEKFANMVAGGYGPATQAAALIVAGEDEG